jgi:hypothetical protein
MISWLNVNLWWIVGVSTIAVAIAVFLFLLRRKRSIRYSIGSKRLNIECNSNISIGRDACISARSGSVCIGAGAAVDIVTKPEWYEVLHEELNRLPIGKVVFNPPDIMKLGVKDRIETRITRDVETNLLASLKGRGIPKSEELKISELMKVRLSGNDFNIESLNEAEQLIEQTGFTEWAWDVIPKKSGKTVLHLHVTLRIRLPFGEERKDHPVLDRKIVVRVNPAYSIKVFIVSYWKWIVTAFILPLIGLLWKIYTK